MKKTVCPLHNNSLLGCIEEKDEVNDKHLLSFQF